MCETETQDWTDSCAKSELYDEVLNDEKIDGDLWGYAAMNRHEKQLFLKSIRLFPFLCFLIFEF